MAQPLYTKIERDLANQISRGELVPNTPIPTEVELCAIYGVSRITVRRAVERLVASRLIYRRRGIGTFVNSVQISASKQLNLIGYLQDILTFDRQLTARIFKRGVEKAPLAVSEAFDLEPEVEVHAIAATNYLDRKPYAVTQSFFANELSAVVPKILMRGGKTSLHYIEKLAGIRIRSGEQSMEAGVAEGIVAAKLGIAAGTPILMATRLYFSDGPRPLEVVRVWYHPERYRVQVKLFATDNSIG